MGQLIPIENIGSEGIVTDIPAWQLPPGTWSNGNNVRFDDVSVKKFPGYMEVMEGCPSPPLYLETYQVYDHREHEDLGHYYWIAFCKENIYCYYGGAWFDVTPEGGLSHNDNIQWQTAKLGAVLVATIGMNMPLWWRLVDGKPWHTRKFETLPNWADEKWIDCQTIQGFKSFLFAGAIYDDAADIRKNRLVAWSDMTNQYTPPESWDYTNPDGDAGIYELLDTEGPIVHMQQLREGLMIYKTDSIVVASFIGAPFMFSFQTMTEDVGLMCKNAITEVPGGHFVMGRTDCYLNNGQTIQPLLTQKVKDKLYLNVSGDEFMKSFAVTDWANSEVWACYPEPDSEYCNKAIVWNFVNNTFSVRDLPQLSHIKAGVAQYLPGDDTWNAQTYEWDSSSRRWGTRDYDNVVENLVFASTGDQKLYRHDAGNTEDGTDMSSYIERTGIDLGDPSSVKHVTAVWPKLWTTGTNSTLKVSTGYQMSTEDPVTWDYTVNFNPDYMSKISVRTTGKLFAIKVESDDDIDWGLSAVEYEIVPAGRRGSRVYV